MKVNLTNVDIIFVTANDFSITRKEKMNNYHFKTGVEMNLFNLTVGAVENMKKAGLFSNFGFRVMPPNGVSAFLTQYYNIKELPAVVWIDWKSTVSDEYAVLTTLNKTEITADRLYQLGDYFASMKKDGGVYYKKDGSVWADLRQAYMSSNGKAKEAVPNPSDGDSEQGSKYGLDLISIPAPKWLNDILDKALQSLGVEPFDMPNIKLWAYVGGAALCVFNGLSAEKTRSQVAWGGAAAYLAGLALDEYKKRPLQR